MLNVHYSPNDHDALDRHADLEAHVGQDEHDVHEGDASRDRLPVMER